MTQSTNMHVLMKQLRAIQYECLGEGREEQKVDKHKSGDSYIDAHEDLVRHCANLVVAIRECNELTDRDGKNERTIELHLKNEHGLSEAKRKWEVLAELLKKELAKPKNKLDDKELELRKEEVKLLKEGVKKLGADHNREAGGTQKNANRSLATNERNRQLAKRREEQEKIRAAKGGKGNKGGDIPMQAVDDGVDDDVQQQFRIRANDRIQQQDLALDQIFEGVKVLHNMADAIGQETAVQMRIIEDTEVKTNQVVDRFKATNARLLKLLETEGGAARWCPIIIVFVILIALWYQLMVAGIR